VKKNSLPGWCIPFCLHSSLSFQKFGWEKYQNHLANDVLNRKTKMGKFKETSARQGKG